VIRRNGVLENGRDLDGDGNTEDEVGAHAKGFNLHSIGVCLVGGVEKDGKPEANFTFQQYQQLFTLLKTLKYKYPAASISGHKDLPGSSTACPSFDVSSFFEHL
jgi:hypothetical protein